MTKTAEDVSDTIVAKATQLNSDDLLAGDITVTITGVSRTNEDQPIAIAIDGGHQPFMPCKSMRRVLVAAWKKDARQWVGKSMTLYRDPDVKWGGEKVGGIRISHLSDIKGPLELMLTESRKSKKKTVILPLVASVSLDDILIGFAACATLDELKAAGQRVTPKIKAAMQPNAVAVLRGAYQQREAELSGERGEPMEPHGEPMEPPMEPQGEPESDIVIPDGF